MKSYAKWLIYYNLNLLSAIINWIASFFGLGGIVSFESDYLAKITHIEYSRELKVMQQRADNAARQYRETLAAEKRTPLYTNEDEDNG